MFLHCSRPLLRGISMSLSNRSMGPGCLREASSANSPLPAARTVNPSDLSNFQTEYCSCTSSSTSKITIDFTSTYSMIREPSLGSTESMHCLTDSASFKIKEDLLRHRCHVIGVSLWRVPVTGKRTLKGFGGTLVWFVPYLNWTSRRTAFC